MHLAVGVAEYNAVVGGQDEGSAVGTLKLTASDVKKMNGDALRKALRQRELAYQGNKKELMQRLLDFESDQPN